MSEYIKSVEHPAAKLDPTALRELTAAAEHSDPDKQVWYYLSHLPTHQDRLTAVKQIKDQNKQDHEADKNVPELFIEAGNLNCQKLETREERTSIMDPKSGLWPRYIYWEGFNPAKGEARILKREE